MSDRVKMFNIILRLFKAVILIYPMYYLLYCR